MSLIDQVRPFRDGDGGFVTGGGKKIAMGNAGSAGMSCHNATYIWMYLASHGTFPSLANLYEAQSFINRLLRFGHPGRVTQGSKPNPGDVLIFTNPDAATVGLHSCVALPGGKICGYNQVDWLAGGVSDTYTEHPPSDIEWVPRGGLLTPRRTEVNNKERYIWAVREATALGQMA